MKVCILNAARVDFDKKLDYSKLAKVAKITRYEEDTPPGKMVERVAGHDIVITKEIPVPGDVIKKFPDSVKMICEAGTGVNNLDHAAAKEKGIMICNIPAYSSDSVAQMVVVFMMNFSCSLTKQSNMLKAGNRDNFAKCLQVPHFELNGKTIGLIGGSGAIGSKVAEIALSLGMKVIISTRSPQKSSNGCIEYVTSVDDLLKQSDFVSIHCPLNDQTRHSIDGKKLKLMKPTAYMINTARGPIIKESDLIAALKEGTIAGAGLDVQDVEPPAADNPLYTMENVVLTPHIGWKRLETRQRLVDMVAQNVAAFIAGKPINVVGAPKPQQATSSSSSVLDWQNLAILGLSLGVFLSLSLKSKSK